MTYSDVALTAIFIALVFLLAETRNVREDMHTQFLFDNCMDMIAKGKKDSKTCKMLEERFDERLSR